MKTDDAAARLEALGNPTRLQIYRALVRAGDTGMAVGKLQSKLDLAASTLSHHLKSLLIVGLISQERTTSAVAMPTSIGKDRPWRGRQLASKSIVTRSTGHSFRRTTSLRAIWITVSITGC